MGLFKKNQVIIYVIALMLVTAGYLNYTATNDLNTAIQTSSTEEELVEMANIGDAQLVSSNDVKNFTDNMVGNNESTNTQNNDTSLQTNSSSNVSNDIKNNSFEENLETKTTSNMLNKQDNKDYFTSSKLERDTMYSQMLEIYEKILNSDNSLETQRQSATEEIGKINNIKNSIMICENLIKTKGFENSVIFVNGESISIIVESDELTKEEVAQVQNIISREMGAKVENIHISNR